MTEPAREPGGSYDIRGHLAMVSDQVRATPTGAPSSGPSARLWSLLFFERWRTDVGLA